MKTARTIDPSAPPMFLTVQEASELAAVSQQTIRNLLIDGIIKGCKLGHVWRVNTRALLDYMSGDLAQA